ncbi:MULTISPECIES: MarR family winged helix-turn-helix transcriptional regulator [Kitasatospora]|uniref:MarR family winged helix-turn-helix transcriptional regulator n=1 Tax=Kitasatospora TaxID=2063 RepID=UPI000C6FF24F|nr:MarR family transcriptional regulator [Kitasatospora sp. GP30]MDH6141547.1 DNA-binding MarR family transcriptional regulator [Kitasatospora sp. GP30]
MKQVHESPLAPQSTLAHDADDCLFDPTVRTVMAEFTLSDETLDLEAAAAVCAAHHAVDQMRLRDAKGRSLSAGAVDLLLRLNATSGEALPMAELGHTARFGTHDITAALDELARHHLVERIPDPEHPATPPARITPSGRGWLDAYRQPAQRAIASLFAGFSPADLIQLRHLALRLVENRQRLAQYLELTEDALS